ncbi:hypothetical protein [Asticcacaulis excentricus]|uniref:hypothetical protein n=1 Tax=Asticcacaulis excentricus TaxID=78587 RepID=UPI000F84A367|nr:hypothetical protein [Asticcacaulis excentricus]
MRDLYRNAVAVMHSAFRRLEQQTPRPIEKVIQGGYARRYQEETVQQAVLLKLARYISGLNAGDLLLQNGYVQELAVLQRTLDEIHEDILFLLFEPPATGEGRGLRKDYLKRFWAEEFEEGVPIMEQSKGRYHIPRGQIRAYIEKRTKSSTQQGERAAAILHQAYSGFVHAAAPFVMEMCEGNDCTFLLQGLLGTHRVREHEEDFWNQHYRGLLSFRATASVCGDQTLETEIDAYMTFFEARSGTSYMADARRELSGEY